MTEFTPLASALGGLMIGLAAVLLMATNGRIAGISGIAARILPPYEDGETLPRLAFVAGLVLAPLIYLAAGGSIVQTVSTNLPLMMATGLLVGFGAVYGGGCTSGHGVCGLARVSARSLAATLTFMGVAMLTVFVVRHL
ncbi:MAG: YeeE/YedE family protein [Micropepsaceae bacterium]